MDRGTNNGFSGTVDLPGIGAEGVQFFAEILGFQERLDVAGKPRAGRGDTDKWTNQRPIALSGSILLTGLLTLDGYPMPDDWKGQRGSVVVQYHTGATQTIPIEVTGFTDSLEIPKADQHRVGVAARIVGAPEWAGFGGEQPSPVDLTPSDQEQWAGTQKTVDPQGLQSNATRLIDVWGTLADTDAAETTLITNTITATVVPMTGQKIRTATFQRDSDDGGTLTITFGLTDTAEDVVNPQTHTTVDPLHVASEATAAAINATPATPTADAFVYRTETSQELNDGKTLKVRTFGLRSTVGDIEYPGTITANDPYDLADSAIVTKTHDTSTIPADPTVPVGQLVEREAQRINDEKWQTVWKYSNLNSEQRIQFPEEVREADPDFLQGRDRRSVVNGSSDLTAVTPPVSRIDGLVLRTVRSTRVGGTPEKWLHVWEYGPRTTEQDVEFPGTVTNNDVSELRDKATVTKVTDDEDPTADAPAVAPLGLLVNVDSEQLTDAGKWRHTWTYGNTTAQQEEEFGNSETADDPQDINDADDICEVTGSSTLAFPTSQTPAALKPYRHVAKRIGGTPAKWSHRFQYRRNNTKDEIEKPGTLTTTDPSDLKSEGKQTSVYTAGGAVTAAVVPSGQQKTRTTIRSLHDGKNIVVYDFEKDTEQQKVEQQHTETQVDEASFLDHRATTAKLDDSVPLVPTSSTYVFRSSRIIPVTHDHNLYVFEYGSRTTAEDLEFPGTFVVTDPSDLRSTGKQLAVYDNAESAPAATVPSGLQKVGTQINQLNEFRNTVEYTFAKDTPKQQEEQQRTKTVADANSLTSEATRAAVDGSPTGPGGVYVLRDVVTEAVTHDHTVTQNRYGLRDTVDDVQMPNTFTNVDPLGIETDGRKAEVYTTLTGAGIDPTPPTDTQIVTQRVMELNRVKSVRETSFGVLNSEQKLEYPRNKTLTDPNDLESYTTLSDVFDNGDEPDDPDPPAGLKLDNKYDIPVTPTKSLRVYEWRKTDSKDRAENPHNWTKTDPQALASEAEVAALDATPSLPSGFVSRGSRGIALTDDHTLNVVEGGLRSTKDDREMPGTYVRVDPKGLDSEGKTTQVYTTATGPGGAASVPSGQVAVYTTTQQINNVKSERVTEFGVLDSEQKRTFPKTSTTDDAIDLQDEAMRAEFWTVGGTAPPLPTDAPSNNVKLIWFTDVPESPTRNIRVWKYGPRDSGDDAVLPHYSTDTDPNGLRSTAVRAALDGASITDPAGYVLRDTRTVPMTVGLTTNRTLTIQEYGLRSTVDDVEMDGTNFGADADGIEPAGEITQVYDAADDPPSDASAATPIAFPADGQLVATFDQELNDGKRKRVWKIGPRTPKQDIEWLKSEHVAEAGALEQREIVVKVTSSATPDSTGLNPDTTNLSLYWSMSHQHTASQYVHVFEFRPLTPTEAMTAQFEQDEIDPASLEDENTRVLYGSTSSPTLAPTVSGKILDKTSVKRVGKAKYRYVYHYSYRTQAHKLEADKTTTTVDPAALDDTVVTAEVYAVSGSPAGPVTPTAADVKLISTTTLLTPNPAYSLVVWKWGKKTSQDELELKESFTETDVSALKSRVQVAAVDATPTAPGGSFVKRLGRVQALTQGLGTNHTLNVDEYGLTTTQQDVEYDASAAQASVMDVLRKRIATVVSSTAAPQTLADSLMSANKSDATFVSASVKKLTPALSLQVLEFDGEDKLLHSQHSHCQREAVRGLPTASLSGASFDVYTPGNVDVTLSAAKVLIAFNGGNLQAKPLFIWRAVGGFMFRRVFSVYPDTTTPYLAEKQYLAVRGLTNNAAFLGYSIGEVMYAGPAQVYTFAVSGQHRLVIDYQFLTDNAKFFNDGLLPEGTTAVNSGSITTSGMKDASQLDSGFGVTFPGTATFSGFIT